MIDENEAIKAKRRDCLVEELGDYGEIAEFDDLLFKLQVENEYKAFQHRFRGIFAAMAFRAIAYVDRTAVQPIIPESIRTVVKTELTCDTDDSVHAHLRCFNLYQASKCFGMKHEHVLVQYIDEMLQMAKYAFDNQPSHERKTWSMPQYIYGDNQSKPVAGSTHKVDYTIHFNHMLKTTFDTIHILVEAKSESSSTISDANFGQISDYAHSLWSCQPTRLFVPVILIHGVQLSLFIFTRDKWYRINLGMIAYTVKQPDVDAIKSISLTFNCLLYLLILLPQKSGHFCDVTRRIWGEYEFVHRRDSVDQYKDSVLVDVNISKDPTDSSINIHSSNRIERTINPRGPIAHMFRTEKNGRNFILKLAWTPVKQLPESAVYDALKAANIPNIPLIIDSGIIIENSFGYRVEYLLIEDCGVPLVEYLQTQMLLGISKQSDIAASAMFQAVECIYSAWNAGILHRDITADSVVVKGDQVRIIDWGYTKLVKDGPVDVDALATKWLFNKDNATGDEGSSAPIIGTPLYTSIPVLVGATQRSIADDVESVLYVTIDALYKQHANPPIDGMVGVKFSCSKSLALMRGGCLSDVDFYRQSFGVPYSSERFTWLTDTFRDYLFIRNGEYIGSKLSTQSRFERTVEIQQLERILEQIKERIQSEARSQNAPSNTSRALGNIPDRNAPPATKHTLEKASSLALPVETPGAGTSATKRSRKATADKNTEPPRRSKRIQEKKKHRTIKK
ncbi:hypothetical protein GGH97_000754 [Coemansia sp. RSA 475]|nr:hypothetical protein GGH97_000754 [Coemansia sp. RSA 475]KAJ2442471.1 hypothetical protein IWW46_003018 [Coemansia sp. RSA 2440]